MHPLASPWTSVSVEAATAAARRLTEMNASPNRGGDLVNDHEDASIQADMEAEAAIMQVLEARRVTGILLSEEYLKDGQLPELSAHGGPALDGGRRVYVVADPLDGSAMYARNVPLWWYSCVGVYDQSGQPLAGCVVDIPRRVLYAADEAQAFRASLDEGCNPTGWSSLRAQPISELEEAWIEVYTMKPRYLAESTARYGAVISGFRGIVPNGGPAGFTDCADGIADVYLHYDLPGTEHMSGGCIIAERAGCTVTDRAGRCPEFTLDMALRPELICANSARLHAHVLELLAAGPV